MPGTVRAYGATVAALVVPVYGDHLVARARRQIAEHTRTEVLLIPRTLVAPYARSVPDIAWQARSTIQKVGTGLSASQASICVSVS
eukprot:3298043-Rhodomonas_salina.1